MSEQHPRGTLALLALYAVLFTVGLAALYFLEFLGRGGPRP
jgi:hypothetical protein